MTTALETVKAIAPGCSSIYLDGLDAAEQKLADAGILANPLRASHFLGQFLGETGGGHVLQESGDYKSVTRLMQIFGAGHHSAAIQIAEAERLIATPMPAKEKLIFERVYGSGNPHKMAELGNRPGDGWPFRGTGPLQSTGRGAAKRWADRLGIAQGDDQLWMLDAKLAFLPSIFEWQAGALNGYADQNDGRHIRRIINGGYNGLADCEEWQAKAYAALRDPVAHAEQPWQQANPSTTTGQLQNALNLLGYRPELKPDGRYGPMTKAAVRWFQTIAGLKIDGIAGPVTMTAINLRFATKRGA